jgi:Mn2+/Fe2+ NRAMP family transporter
LVTVLLYTTAFAALCVGLEVFLSYARYADVLRWLTLSLFAYVAVAFAVGVPWGEALTHTFVPTFALDRAHAEAMVAMLGTTISTWRAPAWPFSCRSSKSRWFLDGL